MQRPAAPPFATLSLPELEEAGGELVRRIAVALRGLGEAGSDRLPAGAAGATASPRQRVARLAALTELSAAALARASLADPTDADISGAGGGAEHAPALEREAAALAAGVMYAAPTLDALLARLEQDRRLLTSLARAAEPRLDERHATPLGFAPLRTLVAELAIAEPARCAQAVEWALAAQRAAERHATDVEPDR